MTVIEPNPAALEILADRCPKIEIINRKFEDCSISDSYDLVMLIEVLGNFTNISHILKTIQDLLDDEGLCIFTGLNASSWKYQIRKLLRHTNYPGVNDYFNYVRIVENLGYRLINVKGFNWIPLSVNSNNLLVPFWAYMEKTLSLGRNLRHSPELLFCIAKNEKART